MLKCGIIGLGIGEAHAATCANNPNVELVKVCDFDSAKAAETAEKFNCVYTIHAAEMLEDPEIELLIIASYDSFHFEQASQAMINGKDVYIEKPVVCNVQQTRELRQIMQQAKRKLSSNLVLRTCPLFSNIRNEISTNSFKNIYYIQAAYLWGRTHKIINGWRKSDEGYSIIAGAAVHMIDLVTWLLGELPKTVSACGNRIATNGITNFDDFNTLRLIFASGLIADISAHAACAHPHFHELKIFGSEKSFYHDLVGSRWINQQGEITENKDDYPARDKRHLALDSFINSIINPQESPLIPADDVFQSLSICLAAQESLQCAGKQINITYY